MGVRGGEEAERRSCGIMVGPCKRAVGTCSLGDTRYINTKLRSCDTFSLGGCRCYAASVLCAFSFYPSCAGLRRACMGLPLLGSYAAFRARLGPTVVGRRCRISRTARAYRCIAAMPLSPNECVSGASSCRWGFRANVLRSRSYGHWHTILQNLHIRF